MESLLYDLMENIITQIHAMTRFLILKK